MIMLQNFVFNIFIDINVSSYKKFWSEISVHIMKNKYENTDAWQP